MIDMEATAAAIGARREILDWRDRHTIAATLTIARACQDVRPEIEEKLAAITWRSALTEPDAFIAREIDPLVAGAVNDAARRAIAAAQTDLNRLVAHRLAAQGELSGTPEKDDKSARTLDLIAGLAPLMGGIGVAAAVPGMAVITGAAFFGLVATATVSPPILVGGMALAGAGIATGVLQTSRIKDKRTARIRARVTAHVDAAVLSTAADQLAPSVLARLHHAITTAADTAIERINDAG